MQAVHNTISNPSGAVNHEHKIITSFTKSFDKVSMHGSRGGGGAGSPEYHTCPCKSI